MLDGFLPIALPSGPLLLLHPPQGSQLLAVQGDTAPGLAIGGDERNPLLQGVDLGALRIGVASQVPALPWAREVLGGEHAPLILAGVWQGRPASSSPSIPVPRAWINPSPSRCWSATRWHTCWRMRRPKSVVAGDDVVLPAPSEQAAVLAGRTAPASR